MKIVKAINKREAVERFERMQPVLIEMWCSGCKWTNTYFRNPEHITGELRDEGTTVIRAMCGGCLKYNTSRHTIQDYTKFRLLHLTERIHV